MNSLLQLKGKFEQKSNNVKWGSPNLPPKECVKVLKLEYALKKLLEIQNYWNSQQILPGVLISVFYNKVTAKSNRMKYLFKNDSKEPNKSIVGAKFSCDSSPKHIITHYISKNTLNESIKRLSICIDIMKKHFNGEVCYSDIEEMNNKEQKIYNDDRMNKRNFIQTIVDIYHIEKFDVQIDDINFNNDSIITIYKTELQTKDIFKKIGIDILSDRIMNETTILLKPEELEILKLKAPFLISMAVSNLSEISKTDFSFDKNNIISIPLPRNEPTIGVIDTLFDENVYFSEWVEYINMIDDDIPISPKDKYHGTAVSSIIVDGPTINPDLDDGCGRFKVRHFGVASGGTFNSFTILRKINEIVVKNRDIKVWNLSLGSNNNINVNFISPEASIIDKIQYENDVLFVIAGTNLQSDETTIRPIGAPADSINSVVVNSVGMNGESASYSRKGPVLSFFIKPDISYYGGDENNAMRVCTPKGEGYVKGTSFAAPWISRKLCYLIDILGLDRNIAKAMLIHSSTGWSENKDNTFILGHGIVPRKVDDIVKCQDDEIQFIIQGVSEKYNTYTYNIPVPVVKNKHPFIAKATICYFPACSRNQGVDYTNTELDIYFGRIKTNKGKNEIKSINGNDQANNNEFCTFEKDARKFFRKWDNVKHIKEVFTGRNKDKKAYENGLWGLSIKTKERLEEKFGENLKFGIVITLKEIHNVNRIDEFIKECQFRGWLVHTVDIENRLNIYNIAEEEISFDDRLLDDDMW